MFHFQVPGQHEQHQIYYRDEFWVKIQILSNVFKIFLKSLVGRLHVNVIRLPRHDGFQMLQSSLWLCKADILGTLVSIVGEQGWLSGESARLPPMWPGFDSRTRRHKWIEFVGFLFCSERFFSGYSGFPVFKIPHLIWFDLIWLGLIWVSLPN